MNFEKKLKALDLIYQERYTENEKYNYYSTRYYEMDILINKALRNPLFAKKNAQILIDNLDIVLKYTENGFNWGIHPIVPRNQEFINRFIECLDYFPYKQNIPDLIRCSFLSTESCNLLFTDKFFNKIASYNIPTHVYDSLYEMMNDKQRYNYIKTLLNHHKTIYFGRRKLTQEIKNFLIDNIKEYCLITPNIFDLKNALENEPSLNIVNDYINNNPKCITNSIFEKRYLYNDNNSYKKNTNLKEVINLVIDDIVKNEGCNYSDIDFFGAGSYSSIIFIKDKVLKIGEKRFTEKFANNPYIVKPAMRKKIEIDNNILFLEVSEKVERCNVNEEILFELYCKLRDIGLIWTDVASRNVGRLKKDNVIHWNKNLNPCDEALGLEEYRGNEVLKAGDYVILDADWIFDENDKNIEYSDSKNIVMEFEKRYQEIKQNHKSK